MAALSDSRVRHLVWLRNADNPLRFAASVFVVSVLTEFIAQWRFGNVMQRISTLRGVAGVGLSVRPNLRGGLSLDVTHSGLIVADASLPTQSPVRRLQEPVLFAPEDPYRRCTAALLQTINLSAQYDSPAEIVDHALSL